MPRPKVNAAISTVEGHTNKPANWWAWARLIVKLGKQYTPSTDKEKRQSLMPNLNNRPNLKFGIRPTDKEN